MDKTKLVLAIIGNSNNKYTVADNDTLMAMSDADLCAIVGQAVTNEDAKALLTNSGELDLAGYEDYQNNKDAFEAFKADKAAALQKKIDHIVENSAYTAEMLKGKDDAELDLITNMLESDKTTARAPQGAATQVNNSEQSTAQNVVDFS